MKGMLFIFAIVWLALGAALGSWWNAPAYETCARTHTAEYCYAVLR